MANAMTKLGISLTKYITIPLLLFGATMLAIYFFYLVSVEVYKELNKEE